MTKLANRVISVFNRKTSMRLAVPEWIAVDDICKREHIKRKKLFELIERNKDPKLGFTCSVRLFAITYLHNNLVHSSLYSSQSGIKNLVTGAKPENEAYPNIVKTFQIMS